MSRWRTGRKVGRTIYMQTGPEPSDFDNLIGVMDTPWLAQHAVDAVNRAARLAELKAERLSRGPPMTRWLPAQHPPWWCRLRARLCGGRD